MGDLNLENTSHTIYALLGLTGIIGAFKTIDWLISLKYMTKDSCALRRQEVAEKQTKEDVKLTRIETKVDMLLERWRNES